MEKSKGRVRNFVVSNKEVFCDLLARTLCKMQVDYLQIENEFHFSDKILRFYSFEECLELNGQVCFVSLDKDKIVSLDPQNLLFARDKDALERVFLTPDEEIISSLEPQVEFPREQKRGFSYTKQKRRKDNKLVNQRLKQNINKGQRFVSKRKNYM